MMFQSPEVKYIVPNSLKEACSMLSREEHGIVLAGGTDILLKLDKPEDSDLSLISLKRLDELKQISKTDEKLIIGAMVTLATIENDPHIHHLFPVLSKTASGMASPQIRNTATIGGNLCNAAPSADLAPPLLVLDAEVRLVSLSGRRTVSIADFFKEPNVTIMGKGEILESIQIPLSSVNMSAVYKKYARRAEMDIATVGIAVAGRYHKDSAKFETVKLAYGAVAPVPFRAFQLEEMLQGHTVSEETIDKVSTMASEIISPVSNIRSTADYRRDLTRVFTKRLLLELMSK